MMKTKWILPTIIGLALGAGVLGCNKSESTQSSVARQYTCPMHSEIIKDSPGNCPKCGMKLVEKK